MNPLPARFVARMCPALVAVVAAVGPGVSASAQGSDANRVVEGDTVRLMVSEGSLPVTASFLGWDGDIMMLDVQGLESSWAVSVFDMHRLEVFTERTSREGFRHGAVLGGATGLFLGAAIGVVLNASGVTNDPDGPPSQIITQAMRGGGIGILLGAAVGGVWRGRRPGRGWVNLGLPGGG